MKLHYSVTKLLCACMVMATLNACEKNNDTNPDPDPDPTEEHQYAAVVCIGSWPSTAYYIANVPSLTEGTITIQGNGAEMTGKVYAQDVPQKNGYYYHANAGSGRFGKYHVENGTLIVDKEIPYTWLNWSSYVWVDDETMVIFGTGADDDEVNEGRYSIVKVDDMTITNGKLDLKAFPNADFTNYSIGFAEYRSGKLFIGYQFASDDWSTYPVMKIYNELDIAVVNYPDMTLSNNISDIRSTTPGGPIVYAPSSFVDENNDLYFVTDPVSGYDYESPSVIYRIKNGETELDGSYYFNLSSKTENGMGAAMWYIGNGKAIIRTRVAGETIDLDHFYTIVDVRNGNFIKKLDLPADKGERMVQAVVVEDGKAYIAVNAEDKDYIWQYDPSTEALTPGAEFIGGIDYILRLEKVK
ncbi:DUF4374 domain-containing protein [Agriterribacter sp.]|uniref:DUF4374 domain-containing protein n=1 Tax=Agriterribacter sp. TaxID=2821509 RepID=UPI002B6BCDBB|nr:DUF4374 domain-containing protein [Agriterribacter sp.]HRP54573.1 DUF4374 domain-containing protein [Agriterribacter sp.]